MKFHKTNLSNWRILARSSKLPLQKIKKKGGERKQNRSQPKFQSSNQLLNLSFMDRISGIHKQCLPGSLELESRAVSGDSTDNRSICRIKTLRPLWYLTVVSLLGKLTNLYKVESIIYMVLKFKKNKKKKGGGLWGEARAFKRTVKMPTIFKCPLKIFFGLKYSTLNVNGRMSLIHHGHLCNANPCPPPF